MTTRSEAIGQIRSLITEYQITREECLSLFPSPLDATAVTPEGSGSLLQRVMVYIGGVFIFMGLCVYIGMIWDDLNALSRVIVSLGSGFVAFMLGLFCLSDIRFSRAATPLFIIAAALEPTGMFVFMDEYLPHTGDIAKAATIVFGILTLQQCIAFIATRRTALLFFSVLFYFAALSTLMNWLEIDAPDGPLALGITGLMVSYGIARTEHRVISSFFFFFSAILTAAASFDLLSEGPLDVLLIGVAAAMIYLSTLAASRTLLTIGVLSLLAYLGYFTDEYFSDLVGWPIAMIIMGFLMIGISVFAVKLGKKFSKTA